MEKKEKIDPDEKKIEPEKEPEQAVDDGLVEMTKNGETLRVNPACVANHTRLGWKHD